MDKLTLSEKRMLSAIVVLVCGTDMTDVKVDFDRVSDLTGLKNVATARACFHKSKKKIFDALNTELDNRKAAQPSNNDGENTHNKGNGLNEIYGGNDLNMVNGISEVNDPNMVNQLNGTHEVTESNGTHEVPKRVRKPRNTAKKATDGLPPKKPASRPNESHSLRRPVLSSEEPKPAEATKGTKRGRKTAKISNISLNDAKEEEISNELDLEDVDGEEHPTKKLKIQANSAAIIAADKLIAQDPIYEIFALRLLSMTQYPQTAEDWIEAEEKFSQAFANEGHATQATYQSILNAVAN